MIRHATTPAWIYFSGLTLATTAGAINAVGFLGQHHQALSHMTGSVSMLGMELARTNYSVAFHTFAILAAFFLVCLLSGTIIQQSTLRRGASSGDYLAAMACGLQIAMATPTAAPPCAQRTSPAW
jgi:uncharacterized membrane protein YoaK (UPF0700 family)